MDEDQNTEEHRSITEKLNGIELDMVSRFERLDGKINVSRAGAFVAWAVVAAIGWWGFDAYLQRLEHVSETLKDTNAVVQVIDKRQSAWEPMATRWGKELEHRDDVLEAKVDKLEKEIKELRRGTSRHWKEE